MRNIKVATLLVVLCGASVTLEAATVDFLGSVSNPVNPLFVNGTAVSLTLDYTPAVGLQAVVNSAALAIGGDSWTTLTGATNFVTILDNGAGTDDLSIQLSFGPSANGLGNLASAFNMIISGGVDLGAGPDASAVNVGQIAANGNSAIGSLFLFPENATVNFSGTAVPEPSSVFAMGAIGLCLLGGAWRKRSKQLAA